MIAPKILVVDDEPQVLVALGDVLSDSYQVLSASSGTDALRVMEEQDDIAVLLTDQRMPGMTGCEMMMQLPPTCRTQRILITGFADVGAVVRAINEGKVFAYVTKPWDSDDLRAKVATAADHYTLTKRLQHEQQLLHDLMNNTPDGVAFRDAQHRFQRVNRAFARLLGESDPQLLVGKVLADFVDRHSEVTRWMTEDQAVLDAGEPLVDVIRDYGDPNSPLWVSETVAPIRGDGGRPVGLVNIARDVSPRLRMERELRENEKRLVEKTRLLDSVFRSMDDGVVVADAKGQLVFFNRRAEILLGSGPDGHSVDDWAQAFGVSAVGAEELPPDRDPIRHALDGRRSPTTELVMRRPEQPDIVLSVRATPLVGEGGRPDGAVALLRDVTLRRQLEQQLLQSQKLEALGQLAGGIAHDFGNLLAVVQNYAQLIRKGLQADHPVQPDISEIVEATQRAARLTRQLLVFGRRRLIEPGATTVNPVIVRLEKMLSGVIGRHIQLTTELDPAVLPVHIDEGQLEQLVMNLVLNARDAMPKGGRLTITTRQESRDGRRGASGYAVLIIEDTGAGMSPETKARIFEPFFTTKGPEKGTGLGLATVYGIVRQAGGSILVDSTPGDGTKFTISLPSLAAVETAARPATRQAPLARGTILLVEDDVALRALTARALEAQGFNVLIANDQEHARELCKRAMPRVDVVLTDVVLADGNGPSLTRQLKQIDAHLRVVFMSGDTALSALDLDAAGGTGILRKPFTPEQLAQRIRGALNMGGR